MRTITLTALAAAAVLSGGIVGTQAAAVAAALPALRAAANTQALPIERVRTVCSMNGCAPVLVKRIQKPTHKVIVTAAPAVSSAPAAAAATSSSPSLPSLPSLPSPSAALSWLQGKL